MTFVNIILLFNSFLATVTLVTAVMTYLTREKVQELHLSLNSRLDQLLKSEKELSRKEGIEEAGGGVK